jgi:hypothetical protein
LSGDGTELAAKARNMKLGLTTHQVKEILHRNIDLWIIAILCIAMLLLANEDPFARKAVYAYTGSRWGGPYTKAFYKLFYDLAVSALITVIFYALFVRLPDYKRRQRLKGSLARRYKDFKEDCIQIMLQVSDGARSGDHPDGLMEPDKFRDYFRERVMPDQERWDELWKNINQYYLHELLIRMEILRDEITFILNNVDISKDEPFELLKRLSVAIYLVKDVQLDSDELRSFARFLWWMFTGRNPITGDEGDPVAKMIDLI